MARNSEKAMTALARWRRMKEEEEKGPMEKRPNDVRLCDKLEDAERYRREVLADIARKIANIQNPGLGEFKIRDLNDDINKMIKIKNAWERRISELGGPDYRKFAPRELDKDGREVQSNRGYKYFGAAKDLPGVRELFQKEIDEDEVKKRATRKQLIKNVDAHYYGYMDEDDGWLIPLEKPEEEKSIQRLEEEWERRGPEMNKSKDLDDNIYQVEEDSDDEMEPIDVKESVVLGDDGREMIIKHVMVPSQKDIEEMIVERKKQALLAKFVGGD
ncbi:unnamed protein product [Bursaphelenchus xylophilus]|uniref:(pine wood nematode) hypothetical protein n=1 Tax=Bursaphelenchus xylophilus TaxID=6326 RepID=A0A1I7S9Y7_BURXY|nr:unnamed protein product [Bursaphelenchus xylophilus]CAG9126152.1 unnamed protein product [Bursaphelenchus xylophilus]